MLIHEGNTRTLRVDLKLSVILAAMAGALNAAGFQATGFFSANMTGNASSMSDHIGLGDFGLAALFATLIAAFISGAFVSGMLIELGRSHQIKAIYAYSILFEAVLLAVLGIVDIAVMQSAAIVVVALSFLMGLQNATSSMISNGRVRSTHISGMATDIGLNLATLLSGKHDQDTLNRLALHGSTLLSFCIGGVIGVLAYLALGGAMMLIAAAALLAVAIPEIRRTSKS